MKPRAAAQAWYAAVRRGDAASAWRLFEPAYREVIAQRWAADFATKTADLSADYLRERAHRFAVTERSDDENWTLFVELMRTHALCQCRRATEKWGWSTDPRPITLDCELVLLLDTAAIPANDDSPIGWLVPAINFYMRRAPDGRWLVAGVGEKPPDLVQATPG